MEMKRWGGRRNGLRRICNTPREYRIYQPSDSLQVKTELRAQLAGRFWRCVYVKDLQRGWAPLEVYYTLQVHQDKAIYNPA